MTTRPTFAAWRELYRRTATPTRELVYVSVYGVEMVLDESYIADPASAVETQVREYERGERRAFDLDVSYPDTFTGRVMRAIAAVPYGEVRTYGELSAELDTSPVAVGGACGRNPVPVVVPCHRIVGADSLGGFSAPGGTATKRRLLDAERSNGATAVDASHSR